MKTNLYNKDLTIFTSRGMQNNTYVLTNNQKCIIIDPSTNDVEVERLIQNSKLTPVGIILTHAHYDHIGDSFRLAKLYNIKVYLHTSEKIILEKYHMGEYLNMKIFIDMEYTTFFNTKILKIDNFSFDVLLTPGHTPGGIILKYKHYVFSGDTIFYDSVGRTDLPHSNAIAMQQSIQAFKHIYSKGDLILPGHGKIGLYEDVLQHNPFLK
jgi:glyoxylase-like metal-dependent hydrolase (beta-lactamase superfamily II)